MGTVKIRDGAIFFSFLWVKSPLMMGMGPQNLGFDVYNPGDIQARRKRFVKEMSEDFVMHNPSEVLVCNGLLDRAGIRKAQVRQRLIAPGPATLHGLSVGPD